MAEIADQDKENARKVGACKSMLEHAKRSIAFALRQTDVHMMKKEMQELAGFVDKWLKEI